MLSNQPTPIVPDSTGATGQFPLTQWSIVSGAQKDSDSAVLEALDRLARLYWRPLHVFAMGKGWDHHAAADAVQGFFGYVCSHAVLAGVERRETKFRTFLLTVFSRWLVDERRKASAEKRGGKAAHEPLPSSFGHAEGFQASDSPEAEFDRSWARALFEQAKERLLVESIGTEQEELSKEVVARLFLPNPDWEAVAAASGQSHGSIRLRATRLRQRFSVLLRQQVRAVVSTDAEVAEELRYILACLAAD